MNATDHIGLIQKIARNIAKRNQDLFEELFQEGCLALVECCNRFDVYRGVAFSSYAGRAAFNGMRKYLDKSQKNFQNVCLEEWDATSEDLIQDIINKELTEISIEYLQNTEQKHKVDAFLCIYIDKGKELNEKANEYNVSTWTIRQRATDIRKELKNLIGD